MASWRLRRLAFCSVPSMSLTASFIFISVLLALTAVATYFLTYETRGKSLEQIASELGGTSGSQA